MAQDCASFENNHSISRAMSHAMHGTCSTSSSSFSSVPGLQRLITSRKPCADSQELHGGDGQTEPQPDTEVDACTTSSADTGLGGPWYQMTRRFAATWQCCLSSVQIAASSQRHVCDTCSKQTQTARTSCISWPSTSSISPPTRSLTTFAPGRDICSNGRRTTTSRSWAEPSAQCSPKLLLLWTCRTPRRCLMSASGRWRGGSQHWTTLAWRDVM